MRSCLPCPEDAICGDNVIKSCVVGRKFYNDQCVQCRSPGYLCIGDDSEVECLVADRILECIDGKVTKCIDDAELVEEVQCKSKISCAQNEYEDAN